MQTKTDNPWYREPYVWLMLAPLIAVVIASFATLGIAIEHGGDSALPGEYRNAGKLIALDAPAHQRSLGIAPLVGGELEAATGRLVISFDDRLGLPEALEVMYVHPTLPERDRTASLVRTAGGAYAAELDPIQMSRGELHVYPADHAWRIVAAVTDRSALRFGASRR